MSSSRKLSEEEVAALLEGLEDGALDVGTGVLPGKEYQPYALGNDDANLLGDLYTLRLINERFGRQFRNILLPMLRFAPRVQTMPPETKRFDEYLSGLESFLSLTTLRVDELKGSILATVPARLISILVNSFFWRTRRQRRDPGERIYAHRRTHHPDCHGRRNQDSLRGVEGSL